MPYLVATPVTPKQVTVAHTLAGVAAALAVVHGSRTALVVAAVLWEAHLVLDCLDGVLARVRGTASAHGHTVDIIGDSVAYLALAAAMYLHVRARTPSWPAGTFVVAMVASAALAAWAHDFYFRKIAAALTTGTDPIYEDLLEKHRALAAGHRGFVVYFGWIFAWLQVTVLVPAAAADMARRLEADEPPPVPGESAEVRAIVTAADGPAARSAFRMVSLMSNDIGVTLLGCGLLIGQIRAIVVVATVYATMTLLAGVAACRRFLAESLDRGHPTAE